MPDDLPPHVRMATGAHDRQGIHRRDQAWLDDAWSRAQVLRVAGARLLVDGEDPDWTPSSQVTDDPARRVLLGEADGVPRFAVLVGREAAEQEPERWRALRDLLPDLSRRPAEDGTAPLVFHALGIAEWVRATRFCPRCARPLELRRAGHELSCSEGHVQFPRLDPAVIMTVTSGEPGSDDERCLLGRQAVWPEGRYSTLAGFCEPGESLEDTVRRETLEETGVEVGEVVYFGNQPWPLPQSLMLGFIGRALTEDIDLGDDELADARWVTRRELREQAEAGTLLLPGRVSISRSLIEHWYGGELAGQWA